jgi:hypothetical protein
MNDPSARGAGEPSRSLFPVTRTWWVAAIVAIVMVVLAMIGVGLATTSPASAPAYWIALLPIFGILCIGTAWARARHGDGFARMAVVRQIFHWLGIGVAISLDFIVRGTGQETATGAGLTALLLLALGCFLAGVHLEVLFIVVGILLGLTLIVLAKADQYLWLIFIVGGLAIAGLFGLQWLLNRAHGKPALPRN